MERQMQSDQKSSPGLWHGELKEYLIKVRIVFVLISNHNRFTKVNSFGTEEFVQFRQVFGLHRFKLHSYLVYRTVKSVWFRQVFGLLTVQEENS
jgi:hypothetical protein